MCPYIRRCVCSLSILCQAIASGVTTLLGGGTGPATGSRATTCTPHPEHVRLSPRLTLLPPSLLLLALMLLLLLLLVLLLV